MKNKNSLLFLFLSVSLMSRGQSTIAKVIQQKDSLFWVAYNTCEIEYTRAFLGDNVEFYHDKGGSTLGKENLINSLKKNLCSNLTYRLRREPVEGTVKVFPLKNGDTMYGAIISGEHVFYVTEKSEPERLDGRANFLHVWLLENGTWKMARILSYDHRPASYLNKRKSVQLADKLLDQYVGSYEGSKAGNLQVFRSGQSLILLVGGQHYTIYPEKDGLFFHLERDLTFEFAKNEQGRVIKLIIRERGKVVEQVNFMR